MGRRLSPQQLKIFKGLIQGKRVLDVGDERSQFLASEFARYAKAWTVVGRTPPPDAAQALPPHVIIQPLAFDQWPDCPPPSLYDIIVLPFPSAATTQDFLCFQWSAPEQLTIFFGYPKDDPICGSPEFWKFARTQQTERDDRDLWSRMAVFRRIPESQKQEEEEEEEEKGHGRYPKKGARYRLAASFRWPGKQSGERPPVVEITKTWEKNAGSAKIVGTGEILRLHGYDLGAPM